MKTPVVAEESRGRKGSLGRGRRARSGRLRLAGFLVGASIGIAATLIGRRAEQSARRGLVNWDEARSVAVARLRRAPGTLTAAELRAAEPAYLEAVRVVSPALEAALGSPLPGIVERVSVVDRAGWVDANLATFAGLFARIERDLVDQVAPVGGGLAKASVALANRWVTSQQLGFFLGFLGTRVLGQYDLALLSAESTPGRLIFVEENIRQIAATLDVPLDQFRTWIALHETTHAFEFEAHPWLRPYLAERIDRQLAGLSGQARALDRDGLRRVGRLVRGAQGDSWMERFLDPEPRRLFRETQAVMSLLEGFSDFVMDEAGKGLVADVEMISERFHARRAQRKSPVERAIMRITGMDLKMEQYAKGEKFVRAIAERGGQAALTRLWEGPETMPRPEEIDAPDEWLARVMGRREEPA